MRIVSWNVNGIRSAHAKGFGRYLRSCDADIIALQEVRATPDQVPKPLQAPKGWHTHIAPAQKLGYSGVGLFSRRPWDALEHTVGHKPFDSEGRIQRARFGRLHLVNGYFPNGNGKNRDLSRIPYKLKFYRHLKALLQPLVDRGDPVLVMGDFNTALEDIDLARPKDNVANSGFRPEERAAMREWLEGGWVDTFRHFNQDGGHYTWWSQRPGVRAKNIGWRIDYVLASPAAMKFVRAAAIHPQTRGSDHCPISVEVNEKIFG